jgi:ribosomal protein S18 acetylase RimI-like enzyme
MNVCVRKGTAADVPAVGALWQSLVGTPGCTWDEEYPCEADALRDVEEGSLYVLCTEDGEIIGAMAAAVDEELWIFDFWSSDIKSHCGCARLGIAPGFHNQGLAKILFSAVETDVVQRGFDGIGFLVSPNNPAALKVYNQMGYVKVGEAWMYDQDWHCYEKNLRAYR